MRLATFLAGTALLGSSLMFLPTAKADSAKGSTVALIVGVKGDPFYGAMERGAREEAAKLGVKLVSDGPSQWNPALESPIVDAMIARRVDALIVVPNDPQALISSLQTATNNGIPVVTADTTLGDGDYSKGSVTFPIAGVSSDNFAGGKLACTALIKEMGGKGKIYILVSTPNVVSDTRRRDGCKEAIKEAGPSVSLAGVNYTQSNSAVASNDTQAELQKDPDIAGIFGGNTFSAEGAAAAVKTANLQGAVKIASFDAPVEAINALKDKTIDLVIAQQPVVIGATAVDDAVAALESKPVKSKNTFVPFVTITRANVDTPEAQGAIYRTGSGS